MATTNFTPLMSTNLLNCLLSNVIVVPHALLRTAGFESIGLLFLCIRLYCLAMSNRRGRPSLKQSLIVQGNASGIRGRQPALQLKRINADTLSVHDVNTEDEEDLLASPIQSTSTAIMRSKPGIDTH